MNGFFLRRSDLSNLLAWVFQGINGLLPRGPNKKKGLRVYSMPFWNEQITLLLLTR